jgi:hypothetical protein
MSPFVIFLIRDCPTLSNLLTVCSFQTVSSEGFTSNVVLKLCTMDRTLQNQWNE